MRDAEMRRNAIMLSAAGASVKKPFAKRRHGVSVFPSPSKENSFQLHEASSPATPSPPPFSATDAVIPSYPFARPFAPTSLAFLPGQILHDSARPTPSPSLFTLSRDAPPHPRRHAISIITLTSGGPRSARARARARIEDANRVRLHPEPKLNIYASTRQLGAN